MVYYKIVSRNCHRYSTVVHYTTCDSISYTICKKWGVQLVNSGEAGANNSWRDFIFENYFAEAQRALEDRTSPGRPKMYIYTRIYLQLQDDGVETETNSDFVEALDGEPSSQDGLRSEQVATEEMEESA